MSQPANRQRHRSATSHRSIVQPSDRSIKRASKDDGSVSSSLQVHSRTDDGLAIFSNRVARLERQEAHSRCSLCLHGWMSALCRARLLERASRTIEREFDLELNLKLDRHVESATQRAHAKLWAARVQTNRQTERGAFDSQPVFSAPVLQFASQTKTSCHESSSMACIVTHSLTLLASRFASPHQYIVDLSVWCWASGCLFGHQGV